MPEKPALNPQDASEGLLANLEKLLPGAPTDEKSQTQKAEGEGGKPAETDASTAAATNGGNKPSEDGSESAKDQDQSGGNKPDEDAPEGLSPKAKADWKGLKKSRKEATDRAEQAEARAAKAEAELAEARAKAEEAEPLRNRLKEFEERLIVTSLEQHPQFKAYFEGQTNQLLETAKAIGGEKIATILRLPEGDYRKAALKEAFVDLDDVDKARIGGLLNEFEKLNAQRTAELGKAREGLTALQQREQAQRKARDEAAMRELDGVIARWSDPEKGNPLFKKRSGNDKADVEWNAAVDARIVQAKRIHAGQLDTKDIAKASAWAAVGPDLAAHINGQDKTIAELRAENARLKAAKPGLGSAAGGPPAPDTSKMSYIDAVMAQYEGGR